MKRCVLVILAVVLFALRGYCQENQVSNNQDTSQVASEVATPAQTENVKTTSPEEISIYGEIKSVNVATNSITVQYYDYDNDNERSVDITADNNTKVEGVATINDIKQGNWADINYTVVSGKNIAKLISVEKEDDTTTETPAS